MVGDKDDKQIIEWFILENQYCKRSPGDVFRKSAESKMLWTILHNVTLNGSNRAMDAAAKIGDVEIVKWVHENIQDCCTTWAMDYAAMNGHFQVVKCLHEKRTEGCTTDAMDLAAANGHLEIVKWLHENKPSGYKTRWR